MRRGVVGVGEVLWGWGWGGIKPVYLHTAQHFVLLLFTRVDRLFGEGAWGSSSEVLHTRRRYLGQS